jgi:hypothetical protein
MQCLFVFARKSALLVPDSAVQANIEMWSSENGKGDNRHWNRHNSTPAICKRDRAQGQLLAEEEKHLHIHCVKTKKTVIRSSDTILL